jgi:Fic family protein
MEPLLPPDPGGELADMAVEVLRRSAALGAQLRGRTRESVTAILRPMNGYYSNLIEGHSTRPIEIDRDLHARYSRDTQKRELQQEALAHLEVQRLMEERLEREPELRICGAPFLTWLHREFYQRMPSSLRRVHGSGGRQREVVPGALRDVDVEVGRHVAPHDAAIARFLERFGEVYEPGPLRKHERVLAAASAHHRLAWIHPFLDGNGRVARLFTQAYLIRAGVDGHGLWTVTRGLARAREAYFQALAGADEPRRNDYDGRGVLSAEGLGGFCRFFLGVAVDQISFMAGLLDLDGLEARVEAFAELLESRIRLPAAARDLLRDVLLRGEVARGEASRITGLPERTARVLLSRVTRLGLLVSDTPKGRVRLGFPLGVVGYYFPRLYPEGVEHDLMTEAGAPGAARARPARRPRPRPARPRRS